MTTQQIIIVAVLAIAAVVAFRVVTRKPKSTPSDDPNVFMPLLAEEAVKFAAGRGATLDYSPDSVERVESLLAELHESRSAGKLADRDLNLHAHQFGAYIGEVLRRQYGGQGRPRGCRAKDISDPLEGEPILPRWLVRKTHLERRRRQRLA